MNLDFSTQAATEHSLSRAFHFYGLPPRGKDLTTGKSGKAEGRRKRPQRRKIYCSFSQGPQGFLLTKL